MNDFSIKDILRSKEEKRILTGTINGIEDNYFNKTNTYIPCAVVWYGDVKVIIPINHFIKKSTNKTILRAMLTAEIDFIVLEYDSQNKIAIASRIEAMDLRAKIELPKLKKNNVIRVRVIAVGVKHIIVDMYGKEVIINASDLKYTYILNCKELYKVGNYLKVRIKEIDIEKNIYKLSAKDFEKDPFEDISRDIKVSSDYKGTVIAIPKDKSGIIVQLDNSQITCKVRLPPGENHYPSYKSKVMVHILEIKEKKRYVYGYLSRKF